MERGNSVEDQPADVQIYSARLRRRGQITLPQALRESLAIAEGDSLTCYKVDGLIFLLPKPLQVSALSDSLTDLIDEAGLTLADLLQGLTEQRKMMAQERSCY